MIILDTNVVAEFMELDPHRPVVNWLRRQPETMAFTSVSFAEVVYGLQRMPEGRRRQNLETSFQNLIDSGFMSEVFPFDEAAARTYGRLFADVRRQGLPMTQLDAMIAAIAIERGCTLATRNVKHFVQTGLRVVNPWA